MLRTIEAIIDSQGHVSLAENVKLASPRRALVTILEDDPAFLGVDVTSLSEAVQTEKPSHTNNVTLQNEPFVGMWRDRDDILDSTEWVKNLRDREWNLKI
jgi:hypothetical protein